MDIKLIVMLKPKISNIKLLAVGANNVYRRVPAEISTGPKRNSMHIVLGLSSSHMCISREIQ